MKVFLENEWLRRRADLVRRVALFDEEYRRKNISGRSVEFLQKEGWVMVDGKLYSDKMNKAREDRFRKEIDEVLSLRFALGVAEESKNQDELIKKLAEHPSSTSFLMHIYGEAQI